MRLRIGFDMDGVLADFAAAFRTHERQLFGADDVVSPGEPESEEESSGGDPAQPEDVAQAGTSKLREERRRRDQVWKTIHDVKDFWTTLEPMEPGAVRRVYELAMRHRWEVCFITQRPATEGDTVQRQTQRWLVDQGFELPSVAVIRGSRGAAAQALRLTFHVDDNAKNCVDVKSESSARPILISPEADPVTTASAKRLGIAVAPSIGECLNILDEASAVASDPQELQRLAALVGWK